MPLDTTPGGAAADSYASVAEADAYHTTRLFSSAWPAGSTGADLVTKETTLRMAARLLDAYPRSWTGSAVDAIQALGWPRSGMFNRNGFAIPTSGASSIPKELKEAQSELARQLISTDKTADNAIINLGLRSLQAGPVSFSFGDLSSVENSENVTRMIREFNALAAVLPDAVKYLIPASWLKPDPEKRSFILEVLN